ncbi:peptidase YpeB-like protein [Azomonas agilis]|uniref:Peptidase YpeB-like protein n=1 Tax=Azomonas agilis TaxID=116849 RepID=A0A562HZX3_9GAMM|nr:PepSY domain-containing protein [Azomonas agilis]TWH64311.1 peptidase YpeB-like protein [Azomonas agilis]
MKTLIALFGAATLFFTSHSLMARDINLHEAVQLRDSGTIKNFEELNKAALARHPGGKITDTELEQEYGRYIYQVEIRDAKGVDWDLEFDATTGELLRDFRDD